MYVTQYQYVCLIVYLLSAQFDTSGRRQHLYERNVCVFGAQKNRLIDSIFLNTHYLYIYIYVACGEC